MDYKIYALTSVFVKTLNFSIDSRSLGDESETEFRLRVEQIRQTGGDSWLKILDEIQGKEDVPQVLCFVYSNALLFAALLSWKCLRVR